MSGTTYSFRKHRRLPGQDSLPAEQWSDVDRGDSEALFAEDLKIRQERRRQEVRVADNFKALRLRLDLTQTDMAQRLGIALRSIQLYERGERGITSEILGELYALFDVDLHQMFTEQPREPSADWKADFADLTLRVADDVRRTFPNLSPEEVSALTIAYCRHAAAGEPIDGGDLLMCHSHLFKPEDEPEHYPEPANRGD